MCKRRFYPWIAAILSLSLALNSVTLLPVVADDFGQYYNNVISTNNLVSSNNLSEEAKEEISEETSGKKSDIMDTNLYCRDGHLYLQLLSTFINW